MGVFTDHPHTAVTEMVNSVVSHPDADVDIELPELLSVTKMQHTGPTELARAIRKKLKWGSVKEQSKALDLLNGVVANGGRKLDDLYNDSRLLDRLRLMANDPQLDLNVRKKAIAYALSWNDEFEGKGREYAGVVQLKHQLPKIKRKKKKPARDDFMDDEAYQSEDDSAPSSSTSRSHSRSTSNTTSRTTSKTAVNPNVKYRIPKIDLKKEAPKIKLLIAEASKCSTDLTNALQTVNTRRGETSEDNERATILFDKTRAVRRKILRYLQLVESEEFLGSLIHANEELVKALQKYTELGRTAGTDSDSSEYSTVSDDDYEDDDDDLRSVTDSLASAMIEQHSNRAPPPVPGSSSRRVQRVATDDDPFGDSNKVDEAWK
ncbi:CYFA0S45e00166g1_1 [Cyberlindnera fabianii]|uniref:CYFA0S45e00166g1_1 n=1 Tax=Cyberlindnera fabianii TaxID=36022 RepID=A0A061BDL5_CYBFA|nr:LAS seventeen-binding protein 5 [Cyberlindnera fabianii]CDR48046.1 CYFA0S45e00166g1_1 [Cyberlindnera fabianii]